MPSRKQQGLQTKKIELSEYEAEILTERTNLLIEVISEEPEVNITYFIADRNKDGGKYITEKVCLKKIDVYDRTFITSNGITIPMDDVILIEGDIFTKADEFI